MSGHKAVDLMLNDAAQGDANRWCDWPGGDGVLTVDGTTVGSVKLEGQTRSGAAVGISQYATTTAINLSSAGMANFRFAQGKIRVTVTGSTGLNASAIQVHGVMAG